MIDPFLSMSVDPDYVYIDTQEQAGLRVNSIIEDLDPRDDLPIDFGDLYGDVTVVYFMNLGITREFTPAQVTCVYASGRRGTLADFPAMQEAAYKRFQDRPTHLSIYTGVDPVMEVKIPSSWYSKTYEAQPGTGEPARPEHVIVTLSNPRTYDVEFRSLAEIMKHGTGGLDMREFSVFGSGADDEVPIFSRDTSGGTIFYEDGSASSLWRPRRGRRIERVELKCVSSGWA